MTLDRAALLEQYREVDRLMRNNLPHYCAKAVRIQTKTGELKPLVLNKAQLKLHEAIERQRESRGQVRALVLKARQLGISTYTAARFYHRTTLWLGRRTYILTHEDRATQNLFGMAKRIHEHMLPDYKPATRVANANELSFDGLDGGYRVGTAKNIAGGGRSLTINLFHGSEVAFWPHAEQHFGGIMQALPDQPDTEAILESTANGVGGLFYDMWNLAERKQSAFIAIFLPWFVEDAYRREPDHDYQPSQEEDDYARLYGLDEAQLCWMHYKNIELGGQPGKICPLFRQEYPANAAEAFQATGVDAFIPSELVLQARRRDLPEQTHVPRVLGVDIARGGGDLTRFIDRQGRKAGGLVNRTMNTNDLTVIADRTAMLLRGRPDIVRAFIDVTGLGAGVYDILRNAGFADRVVGVNFGSAATESERYINKRAEMWGRMKEWLQDPAGVDIPDDDVLHKHITAPQFRYDANSRLQLEAKESIKKRLGFSPDGGDALALTFAETIEMPLGEEEPKWLQEEFSPSSGDWMTAI